jgi:hypothetical protein
MSTVEFQDRTTSSGWQREVAEETIRGHGVIVAEYFDEGCSRRLPWRERPAAAQLMAAAEQPNRPFDAVVIGEYERAFYGDQCSAVLTALRVQGIRLWLPEADGPVNVDDPVHQALMLLLGSQSARTTRPGDLLSNLLNSTSDLRRLCASDQQRAGRTVMTASLISAAAAFRTAEPPIDESGDG